MDSEGEEIKYTVKKIADNQNIILHVQKNLDTIQKSETAFMATKDESIALKTSQRLSDWLHKLQSVEEVTSSVSKSRRSLVEEITNLKDCIDCASLRRRSRDKHSFNSSQHAAIEMGTYDLRSKIYRSHSLPIPTAEMQTTKYKGLAIAEKSIFKSRKSSIVPVSEQQNKPELGNSNGDANASSTSQNKKKRSFAGKVSKAVKKLVGCGSLSHKKKLQENGEE